MEKTQAQLEEIKKALLAQLPASVLNDPKWPDYVEEAEHQEGLEYWDGYFKNAEELATDFRIYKENLD